MAVLSLGGVVVVGTLSAAVGGVVLASYLARHRGSPGVRWFVASILAIAAWCLVYGVSLLVFSYPLRLHLEALGLLCATWTGPLFLLFALEYTGRGADARSWQAAVVLGGAAAISSLIVTYSYHPLLWTGATPAPVLGVSVPAYSMGPALYLMAGFVLSCTGVGALLLVETVVSYGPLYRSEAAAVALSTIPPSAGSLPWLLGLGPAPQLNLAPLLFVPHLLLDGYAFVGSNMFETNPTTQRAAERSAVDDIGSPVAVLDTADRIVTVNDAAVDVFGLAPEEALGEPLTAFVDLDLTADTERETVTVETDGRDRQFTAVTSPLTDPAERDVGRTVVFQEVTRAREREQRLDVLNRVIRHNLRNEMTVVLGHAEKIARNSENEEIRESAETIRRSGDRLLATGEKAREFERLRGGRTWAEHVDVADLVRTVAAELDEEFPDAVVDVGDADSVTVETDPRVLSLVVGSLLENALEHNRTAAPRAVVSLTGTDGGVEIRISDDGPGINPDELAPIRKGRETSLEHSTGIGLWVVRWGVSMLGGEIEFRTDGDGTDVIVRIA